MLHEGIAVYYGGTGDWDNASHIRFLKNYTDLDWGDYNSYNTLIEGHTNPFYTVGYLIIDHAINNGGLAKVRRLFGYSDLDEMFKHEFDCPTSIFVRTVVMWVGWSFSVLRGAM